MSVHKQLDEIYIWSDRMIRAGRFAEINATLLALDLACFNIHQLIGYLTATLPAKSKIPARAKIYQATWDMLKAIGEQDPVAVLKGLEHP